MCVRVVRLSTVTGDFIYLLLFRILSGRQVHTKKKIRHPVMHGHRGMAIDRPSLAGRGHSNRTRKENPCTKSTSNIVRTPFLYVPTYLLPALPVSFAECVLSSATMSFAVSTLITQKYSQNRKKHQKGEPSAPHKKR